MPSAVDFDRAALDGADPAVRALVEEARAAKALAKRRREKLLESERVVAAQRAEAVKSAATIEKLKKATRALLPGVATRRSVSTRAPIDAARTTDAPRDEDETAPPLTPPPPPRSTALAEFARVSRAARRFAAVEAAAEDARRRLEVCAAARDADRRKHARETAALRREIERANEETEEARRDAVALLSEAREAHLELSLIHI